MRKLNPGYSNGTNKNINNTILHIFFLLVKFVHDHEFTQSKHPRTIISNKWTRGLVQLDERRITFNGNK